MTKIRFLPALIHMNPIFNKKIYKSQKHTSILFLHVDLLTCYGRLEASIVVASHLIALEIQSTVTVRVVGVRAPYQRAIQHVRIWRMLRLVRPATRSRHCRTGTSKRRNKF